ncbi:MAG TPA: arsenate reductase ArsC [Saprospiraceae bacterium]|nr:arsenate reductase ArsC [Saprospiraceae bacterium]
MKILIVCTGNSCRSQMAQGFLQSMDKSLVVFSAGTEPSQQVNSHAVFVMQEIGIDISHQVPEDVLRYKNDPWDWVITVCDDADKKCPVFEGEVKNRLHIGLEDPFLARGSDEFVKNEYRRIRDEIVEAFGKLYREKLKKNY